MVELLNVLFLSTKVSHEDENKGGLSSHVSKLENAKDGFDLIDYPSDFAFKAMCKAGSMAAEQHIRELILSVVDAEALVKLTTNQSRTGKFESVTATVTLYNREQLESIYAAISKSTRVVMTL